MKYEIRFCIKCNEYTLKEECGGIKTKSVHPPKYSPNDKYSSYRLKIKKREWGINNE